MADAVEDLLLRAVKMEEDGRDYYTKIASETGNALAKHTFEVLAKEESRHRQYFEAYYTAKSKGEGWPPMDQIGVEKVDRIRRAENVFSLAAKEPKKAVTEASLHDAYMHAMDLERKSVEFYQEIDQQVEGKEVKDFLTFVIDQERQHLELLSRSLDLLAEPEAWYFDEEHWIVEG